MNADSVQNFMDRINVVLMFEAEVTDFFFLSLTASFVLEVTNYEVKSD